MVGKEIWREDFQQLTVKPGLRLDKITFCNTRFKRKGTKRLLTTDAVLKPKGKLMVLWSRKAAKLCCMLNGNSSRLFVDMNQYVMNFVLFIFEHSSTQC